MTNVELFNALLAVIGIVIGAVALGIALSSDKKRPPRRLQLRDGEIG